jgi:hypothetical protein
MQRFGSVPNTVNRTVGNAGVFSAFKRTMLSLWVGRLKPRQRLQSPPDLLGGPVRLLVQHCELSPGDLIQLNVSGFPHLVRVVELPDPQAQ